MYPQSCVWRVLPREQRGWTRVPASCQEEEYQRQRWLERRQWQDQVQTTSPPVQLLCDWSIMRWCWSLIGQLPDSCGQSWECWVDSQSIKHCAGESTGAGGNLITMLQLKITVSDLICQRIETGDLELESGGRSRSRWEKWSGNSETKTSAEWTKWKLWLGLWFWILKFKKVCR